MSRINSVAAFRTEAGSLASPGLDIAPPVSRGAQALDELGRALGLAGRLASQVYEIEEANRRADEKLSREHEAQGFNRAAAEDANLLRQVETGEITAEPGHEREVAMEVAEGYLDGFPESHREGFLKRFALEELLVKKNLVTEEEARKAIFQENRDYMAKIAKSPAEIEDALKALGEKYGDRMTPEQIAAETLPNALRAAAEAGDTAAFANIRSVIGDRYVERVAEASNTLRIRTDQSRQKAIDNFNEVVSARLLDGQPIDHVIDWAKSQRGNVPDDDIRRRIDQLETEKRVLKNQSDSEANIAETKRRTNEWTEAARSLGSSAEVKTLMESLGPIKMPDGSTLSFDEVMDNLVASEFSMIDQQTPPVAAGGQINPANIARKVDFLQKYPQAEPSVWTNQWAGLNQTIAVDSGTEGVPIDSVSSYQLWKTVRANNALVANRGVSDADVGFLRLAEAFESQMGLTPQGALLEAARKAADPFFIASFNEGISGGAVEQASDELNLGESRNGSFAQQIIADRIRNYRFLTGMPEKAAVKKAVESFKEDYTKSNGFWVYARGQAIQNIDTDAIGKLVVEMVAPSIEGETTSSLTFAPDRNGRNWTVVDDANIPVGSQGFKDMTLTIEDMARIQKFMQDRDSEKNRLKDVLSQIDAEINRTMAVSETVNPPPLQSSLSVRRGAGEFNPGLPFAEDSLSARTQENVELSRMRVRQLKVRREEITSRMKSESASAIAADINDNPFLASIFEFIQRRSRPAIRPTATPSDSTTAAPLFGSEVGI